MLLTLYLPRARALPVPRLAKRFNRTKAEVSSRDVTSTHCCRGEVILAVTASSAFNHVAAAASLAWWQMRVCACLLVMVIFARFCFAIGRECVGGWQLRVLALACVRFARLWLCLY